jgi:hypothetical protein
MLKPLLASPALLLLFAAPATAVQPAAPDGLRVEGAMQHFTIHVPRMTITETTVIMRSRPVPMPPPAVLVERKAKDCLETRRVVGFGITRSDSVDLVLNDGSRMRARLGNNCPTLGFYQGFYVKPNPDGKMCAGRDPIHTRSGGECAITAFKHLVPAR